MEFVKLAFYALFFVAALLLTLFNIVYSFRIHSANYKLGLGTPKFLKRALEANMVISFVGTVIIALVLTQVLVSIRIPNIL